MKDLKMFATINEAAKITGLSRTYIRKLCKTGKAPCIRVGCGENATYKIKVEEFLKILGEMA